MTRLRGTAPIQGKDWKQDLIRSHKYDGPINRDYEGLARFTITYPGKTPYTVSSKKSLEELREAHKGATVVDVQAAYAEQERRNKEYFESKLENYH